VADTSGIFGRVMNGHRRRRQPSSVVRCNWNHGHFAFCQGHLRNAIGVVKGFLFSLFLNKEKPVMPARLMSSKPDKAASRPAEPRAAATSGNLQGSGKETLSLVVQQSRFPMLGAVAATTARSSRSRSPHWTPGRPPSPCSGLFPV